MGNNVKHEGRTCKKCHDRLTVNLSHICVQCLDRARLEAWEQSEEAERKYWEWRNHWRESA